MLIIEFMKTTRIRELGDPKTEYTLSTKKAFLTV